MDKEYFYCRLNGEYWSIWKGENLYFGGILDHQEADCICAALTNQDATIEAQQARIDELMLEWCPDEMTDEQMENWGRHQVIAPDPSDPTGIKSWVKGNRQSGEEHE